MTLRFAPLHSQTDLCYPDENHWLAMSGSETFASLNRTSRGDKRNHWSFSIFRIYEPGWNWRDGRNTRDQAMQEVERIFRQWLDFAGFEETGDPAPQDGPPFTIEETDEPRKRVLTPAGLHIGFTERYHTIPDLAWEPRIPYWAAWCIKFERNFMGHCSAGDTPEESVARLAAAFRVYLASAGLRER